jgi:hypothetical protein
MEGNFQKGDSFESYDQFIKKFDDYCKRNYFICNKRDSLCMPNDVFKYFRVKFICIHYGQVEVGKRENAVKIHSRIKGTANFLSR